MTKKTLVFCAAVGLFLVLPFGSVRVAADPPATGDVRQEKYTPLPEELRAGYERGVQPAGRGRVYKAQVTPHWFEHNTRFWYRNDLRGGMKEFVVVDAEHGQREAAFDHAKLAAALSMTTSMDYKAARLPFDAIEFVEDGKAIQFKVDKTTWKCDLTSYECTKSEASPKPSSVEEAPAEAAPESLWTDDPAPQAEQSQARQPGERSRDREQRSPDGKWTAFIKDNNVYLRSRENEKEIALSQDGKTDLSYGMLSWAPDSSTVAAFRIEPGEKKEVYLITSSPKEGGRAKLETRPYALPGDKFTAFELNLFDVASQKAIKPEVEKIDFGEPRLRWQRDGHHFTYEKIDRGHQRLRVIEVDAHTGESRNLIDEKTPTFIWTVHGPRDGPRPYLNYLNKSEEIIYGSERDGWHHLYLIDAKAGEVKNQITKGEWVVRGVDRVDETERQIWFRASGCHSEQDPYLIHHFRINFDGTGLVALTEGNGSHTIQYSPDRKYLLDTYSRVDLPPVHELRRVSEGKLVCELENADISELRENGWVPPEVFVAKGRDGNTDIWGIIARPRKLDPSKKYPVIESIYAGPQDSFVPKTFSAASRYASLTNLGFIVVQVDGMGTANRSKAFHDVCWHNLADAGFPDRILWHQAVAKKYPYFDVSRVGIYGTSAGGQNAAGAVLFHPEFYKAAVAACGCHDNRMDKASWNEQWMGYPVGPQYANCSNITNAAKLQGKLLLVVGEVDHNVPPESTFRFVDALVKAGKDFDLLVVPGMDHSNGGAYGVRRMQDFFVRRLHGVEPPDHNAARQRVGAG